MVLGKYFKSPADRKRYTIDYTDWLDSAELISTVTFEVTPVGTSVLVIDGIAIDTDAKGVVFYASEGLDGTNYKAFPTMTSSNGQIKEDEIRFTVRDPST